jgi:hypothetical protein
MVSCEVFCASPVDALHRSSGALRSRVRENPASRRRSRTSQSSSQETRAKRFTSVFTIAAPVGVTSSACMPEEYTGAPFSNSTVAGTGTGKLHARISPCRRQRSTASKQSHPLQGLGSDRGADDIDHRVHGAHFVEVHFLNIVVMDLRFCRAQSLKDGNGTLLGA